MRHFKSASRFGCARCEKTETMIYIRANHLYIASSYSFQIIYKTLTGAGLVSACFTFLAFFKLPINLAAMRADLPVSMPCLVLPCQVASSEGVMFREGVIFETFRLKASPPFIDGVCGQVCLFFPSYSF